MYTPIFREQIMEAIPYGDSFLFVDTIEDCSEREIRGRFRIDDSLAFAASHLKGIKIAPGLILVEGLMQTLSYLGMNHLKDREDRYFVLKEFSNIRFRRPVFLPSDVVYQAMIEDWREEDVFFKGQVLVEGKTVIEVSGVVYCMIGEKIRDKHEPG